MRIQAHDIKWALHEISNGAAHPAIKLYQTGQLQFRTSYDFRDRVGQKICCPIRRSLDQPPGGTRPAADSKPPPKLLLASFCSRLALRALPTTPLGVSEALFSGPSCKLSPAPSFPLARRLGDFSPPLVLWTVPRSRPAGVSQPASRAPDAPGPALSSKPAAWPDGPLPVEHYDLLGTRRARSLAGSQRRPAALQAGAFQAGVSGSGCTGAGLVLQVGRLALAATARSTA